MRAGEWKTRLLHEMTGYQAAVFVTWTYDDSNLPLNGSLDKGELQRGLKRLRKAVEPRRFRYYAVGEYGGKSGRPHYHGIVFGLSSADYEVIRDAWGLGFVYVGTVTAESIRYVTGYVQKKLTGALGKEVYGELVPPFGLMSKGLGKAFCDAHSEELVRDLGTTVQGVPVGLPRYYAKRLGVTYNDPRVSALRTAKQHEIYQYHQRAKRPWEFWEESRERSRAQSARNIEARESRQERGL